MKNQVVAIDGPSASGKSTVARMVAEKIGWLYVDSGALYRAVTWKVLQNNIDPRDSAAVAALAQSLNPEFSVKDGALHFVLNGIKLDRELRTETINRNVSPVAANPDVRAKVTGWLRAMLQVGNLVMEGRDIGTAVFADTKFKFYLDASPEERARRRIHQLREQGQEVDEQKLLAQIIKRDRNDRERTIAPLSRAADALLIDSSNLDADDVVARVLGALPKHLRDVGSATTQV